MPEARCVIDELVADDVESMLLVEIEREIARTSPDIPCTSFACTINPRAQKYPADSTALVGLGNSHPAELN
jgi:hypothetical protein